MKNQWYTYIKLEQLSRTVPAPFVSHSIIVNRLSSIWRSLTHKMVDKLTHSEQVELLERCVTFDWHSVESNGKSSFWYNLWIVLNQPLFAWTLNCSQEPKIQQILDQDGHLWWYAFDPLTGQTTYLESEADVQSWLEERFHYYES